MALFPFAFKRFQHFAPLADSFKHHVKSPQTRDMLEHFFGLAIQGTPVELRVTQRQCAIAMRVDGPDLDIRFAIAEIVLVRQLLPDIAIAGFIVNCRDRQLFILIIVKHREK